MNSSINIYLLDDFFISKSLFIGKKPDYKASVKDIILTTTKACVTLPFHPTQKSSQTHF